MKVLFVTNIPSPYRHAFFNELGNYVELTVLFEARRAGNIKFNWNDNEDTSFKSIFLREGDIHENRVNIKIFTEVVKERYELIVFSNYAYLTEMAAIVKAILWEIPYVLEIDGGIIKIENIILKKLKTLLISHAKFWFSSSQASDRFLIHHGALQDNIYRYSFTSLRSADILSKLPDDRLKETLRSELKIVEKKIVIGVGQYIYRKGFDVLLKAARLVDSSVGIYIIGGMATADYLEYVERYNLKHVHFLQFMSKDELTKWYCASDVFVLPTREDVWGLVINEAMACGLPVITTDKCIAGLELIENGANGFIVPTGDAEMIAMKINYILNNSDQCQIMKEAALEKIQTYTIENMAKEHYYAFLEILSKI